MKWEDGIESFVSVGASKHGPMEELIAKFEADQAKKRVSVYTHLLKMNHSFHSSIICNLLFLRILFFIFSSTFAIVR